MCPATLLLFFLKKGYQNKIWGMQKHENDELEQQER